MKKIIIVLILIALSLNLTACVSVQYLWETDTHDKFEEYIVNYNSLHDLYTDTYISFDLDDIDDVSKRQYHISATVSMIASGFRREHGYIIDALDEGRLDVAFLYYIKSEGENANEYAYKIKCDCRRVDFNFTKDEQIEILPSPECYNSHPYFDLMYEEELYSYEKEVPYFYNYSYHYSIYANGEEICCIHISSIDEPSEEKLNEIIQLLLDNLVVINADGFFVWRGMK